MDADFMNERRVGCMEGSFSERKRALTPVHSLAGTEKKAESA